MNRLLLSLLALFAGLVAQVSPAQAEVERADQRQVGAVQIAAGPRRVALPNLLRVSGKRLVPRSSALIVVPVPASPALELVAIRIGIDRARE